MQYSIIQTSRRLEINNERGQHLGIMEFDAWKPAKVRFATADNNIYEAASVGFWKTKTVLNKNGQPYAEIEPKIGKGFNISFINGPTYLFRKKGFWNSSEYLVIDNADSPVATLKSVLMWKLFKFRHNIDVNESLLSKDVNSVIPFIIIYCIRLLRARQGAAGA